MTDDHDREDENASDRASTRETCGTEPAEISAAGQRSLREDAGRACRLPARAGRFRSGVGG